MAESIRTLTRSVTVDAPAERVWALVSDLPGMGAFSPENAGGTWIRGAVGPAAGAQFRGRNRRGGRRWSTRCTVLTCAAPRRFSFAVSSLGLPVAEWSYAIEPLPVGCRLTETWTDRRGLLITVAGRAVSGVADRAAYTAQSIERTLAAVKARAETQD